MHISANSFRCSYQYCFFVAHNSKDCMCHQQYAVQLDEPNTRARLKGKDTYILIRDCALSSVSSL